MGAIVESEGGFPVGAVVGRIDGGGSAPLGEDRIGKARQ